MIKKFCNNYFSEKENEHIIFQKISFQAIITLIIVYLFGIYEIRDIALIIGAGFLNFTSNFRSLSRAYNN